MTTMIGSLAMALRTGGNALPRGQDAPAVAGVPTVRLGDRRILPSLADDDRLEYLLPPCDALFIDSHATSPAVLRPGDTDRRYLGVAICRIRVRNLSQSAEIALDNPALGDGWWGIETRDALAYRWTDGHAALTLPEGMRRGAILELTLCGRAPDPEDAQPQPGGRNP